MNDKLKLILMSIAVFLLISFIFWIGMGFNKPEYKVVSPNKYYVIELYDFNGGATTGFFTTLEIRQNKSFLSKLKRKTILSGTFNPATIKIVWVNDKRVLIQYPEYEGYEYEIDKKMNIWKDIEIEYEISEVIPLPDRGGD